MRTPSGPVELTPAEIIKRVLRIKGWTQAQLAKATGITEGTISLYKKGKKIPRPRQMERILAHVGIPLAVAASLAAWDGLLAESPSRSPVSPADPMANPGVLREVGDIVNRAVNLLRLELALLSERAETLWDRLNRFTPEDRRWLVQRDPAFWRPSFCLWLCEESARKAADDAVAALELAELARSIARQLRRTEPSGTRLFTRLEGQTEAFVANALRVAGELDLAESAFQRAWSFWHAGIDDANLLSEARLLDLEASLRRAQRRFEQALRLHSQALQRARPIEQGALVVNMSVTREVSGDSAGALLALDKAAPLIDRNANPRLWWVLRYSQALNLVRLRRAVEAEPILAEAQTLAEQLSNGLDLVRTLFLAGMVDAGLGRTQLAIDKLERVCDAFDKRAYPYDLALVGLDLALLYREKGRWAEIRKLADRMVGIFQERQIHRETIAAVILFKQAAEKEAVTVELVRRLQEYFKQAQAQPGLRFEAGK